MLGQLLILNYITYGKDRLKFVGRTFGLLVLFFHRELFLRIQSKRPCNRGPGIYMIDNARLWIRSISSLKYFGME